MIETFDNQEDGYLAWIQAHSADGYVANVDRARNVPQYPMVHLARHRLVSSPKIGNFTTGDYVKFCSTDLEELSRWSLAQHGRALTFCGYCKSVEAKGSGPVPDRRRR